MAVEPWRTGKVIKIEQQTDTTRRFFIQIPELQKFDFKPGQFVTLDLPIHEKPNKRWRSYSIASWPDGSNIFELLIVLLEEGAGTNWLFNNVTEGSELTFATERKAEDHGLKLCKEWIDEQKSGIDSSSLPLKGGALSL